MSRKYKIIIAIVLALLLGVGIYIGCRHNSRRSVSEQTDLILWYVEGDEFHDAFADIAEEYEQLKGSENVSLEARGFISFEAIEKALKSVKTDDAPDMIACDVNEAALLYESGRTKKCSEYITEWATEELNEDLIVCASIDDGLVTVPYAANTEMMIVNTEKISDADSIYSIEKLCRLSKKYYNENGNAMFTISDYAAFFKTAMAQLGESFDAVSPRYSDSKNCKKIYDLLAETAFDRGLCVSEDPVADVMKGKIPCAIVSATQIMSSAEKITDKVGVYPCPFMKGGEQVYSLEAEGICFCRTDENSRIATEEFVKWFLSKEINRRFIGDSGYCPAVGDMSALASDQPVFEKLKAVIYELSTFSKHADFPANADYAKNYGEFINAMQSVMDSLS